MSVINGPGCVKLLAGVLILSVALLLVIERNYEQEPIEVTFMDIWERNKYSDSFKAGLRATKSLQLAIAFRYSRN